MTAYYNENDPFAAAWLRELIKEGLIASGEVDERSIKDVAATDLSGFAQVHFFAGIGGWSYALRLAGWPDDRVVWTGSCPCQPFSAAGKRGGTADERHLWPDFARLIGDGHPAIVFGEQVASKDGRLWLAGVRADLEAMGYAVGAADLCAAGVGAPHIRQRLFWVADSDGGRSGDRGLQPSGQHRQQQEDGLPALGVEHPESDGWEQRRPEPSGRSVIGGCENSGLAFAQGQQHNGRGATRSRWSESSIRCSDGKARRIEPSIFPLAHGIPNRVGTLRGAGNAIVPQVAAEFIGAYCDTLT